MSVPYHKVLAGIGLRVNAISGALAADLETNYKKATQVTADYISATFPFTALQDSIIYAEEKLAHAIANKGGHPWRNAIKSTTVSTANAKTMPAADQNGKPIIGIWGSIRDASDDKPCTEAPLELIRKYNTNSNSHYLIRPYLYKFDSERIYHTRTGIIADCCVYDAAAQRVLIASGGNILLPDVLEEAYVCGGVSYLFRDDAFAGQAAQERSYFQETLFMIDRGLASVPAKATPSPSMMATST